MWIDFLNQTDRCITVFRPVTDLQNDRNAIHLEFYSDASAAETKGFGCYFNKQFTKGVWETDFIRNHKPSIAYLELYALCIAVFTWSRQLSYKRVIVGCDNVAAVNMVNNTTSGCRNCMVLIRLLTLHSLNFNFRVFAHYLTSESNGLVDALSRNQMSGFFSLAPDGTEVPPQPLPDELWPVSKIWLS